MTSPAGRAQPLSSKHRLQLLIDAVADYAIYMLDSDGFVTSWNAGAERIKGYRADEIIGQPFSRFFTAEDQAKGLPATILATARTTGRFETEGWRVRKDGSRFWSNAIVQPVQDEQGRPVGFAKITRDITERRAAHQALLESERRFRLLIEGVVDYALYMLDPSGVVASWNQGAQRMKGYAAGEIVGQHFSRFYTHEDRAAGLPARVLETAAREGRFEAEGWRLRKDGSRFWASVVVDAIRGNDGRLEGFAKITRDITERRAAQQALRDSERQFRLLVSNVVDYAPLHARSQRHRQQLERRRREDQGLPRGRDHRPACLALLYRARPRRRRAAARPADGDDGGPFRGRRLARAQGRQPVLGPCRDRSRERRDRPPRRLRQDHPRQHRTARGPARPAGGPGAARPGPEDGCAGPADRRRGARFQQSLDDRDAARPSS